MKTTGLFGKLLDAADSLPLDAQEEFVEILQKRLIENRRTELASEIASARADYKKGRYKAVSSKELMGEILE